MTKQTQLKKIKALIEKVIREDNVGELESEQCQCIGSRILDCQNVEGGYGCGDRESSILAEVEKRLGRRLANPEELSPAIDWVQEVR